MVTLSEKVIITIITCISAVAITCLLYYFVGESTINLTKLRTYYYVLQEQQGQLTPNRGAK